MRILVFFDLPVVEKKQRKRYTVFRRFLLNDGYDMIQYSVYCRICSGIDSVKKHEKRLKQNLPEEGSIRTLTITNRQYEQMRILLGTNTLQEEVVKSEQLLIF